jgi:hypothetical protein
MQWTPDSTKEFHPLVRTFLNQPLDEKLITQMTADLANLSRRSDFHCYREVDLIEQRDHRRRLADLAECLTSATGMLTKRRMALAMGTHTRLGVDSNIMALPIECMRVIERLSL